MGRVIVLALMLLCLTSVVRSAQEEKKPQWREAGNLIAIFGNVERTGFYSITDVPISLKQLVVSAGMPKGDDGLIILQRPVAGGAERIAIDARRLKEDGDIPLQANDVIHVTTANAGKN